MAAGWRVKRKWIEMRNAYNDKQIIYTSLVRLNLNLQVQYGCHITSPNMSTIETLENIAYWQKLTYKIWQKIEAHGEFCYKDAKLLKKKFLDVGFNGDRFYHCFIPFSSAYYNENTVWDSFAGFHILFNLSISLTIYAVHTIFIIHIITT